MSLQPKTMPATAPAALPAVPVLAVNAKQAALLSAEGEIALLPHARAQMEVHNRPVLACHAPWTRQRLGSSDLLAFDVLELFAFVHPAKFCAPTPAGLARALGLPLPKSFEDLPLAIMEAAQALLKDLRDEPRRPGAPGPLDVAGVMGLQGKGWNWTPYVFAALGETYDPAQIVAAKIALNVWKAMPQWAEEPPPPTPSHHPVTGDESRARLVRLLHEGTQATEARPQQIEYATAMTAAFAPAEEAGQPHMILAEAGTGVGKTAGYLAPASVWAEKNGGAVWISTYTKNLQRQIGQELDRLYPDPALKEQKAAMRKGRENYLCLLNLEDTVAATPTARNPMHAVAAGLMARWAGVTKDGDMQGGDFPGWLPGLLGFANTRGLADKRGECIYAACDHYHRCFVERAVRKARHADIVVANHALVMTAAANGGFPEGVLPERFVFDEGHHLFDAADSAFAAHLSARETAELRRWLLGPEGGRKTRARGLKKRAEDLIAADTEAETALQAILHAAAALPKYDWAKRLKDGEPQGPAEEFLALVGKQVYARADGRDGPYSLETQTRPLIGGLPEAARKLKACLNDIRKPMRVLAAKLRKNLNDNAQTWDTDTRKRIEAVASGIERRSEHALTAWISMLETLAQDGTPPEFVDWMEIERIDGHVSDIGLYRHWVDPMQPFAAVMKPHAHGVAVTSATLRDRTDDEAGDWRTACTRTGARHLSDGPVIFSTPSPYDYAAQTRIFIVTDVSKNNMDATAAAFRVLFEASGGGALGLFTAIQRLKAVQERIAGPLEEKEIPLYAQHADAIDTGTLVDIFREEINACMLGTDAVRDGIDVPGESLRLLVYDRVPWPRPTILHKARRETFGGKGYDELTTRLKLRQAYGRLIRRASDRGAFVMLDSGLPSRLLTAFPEGVPVERLGLADACARIKEFLSSEARP